VQVNTRAKLTILVSGMIAATPRQGGATWAVLQFLLGFAELGHDVYFVEPLPPAVVESPEQLQASVAYFRHVMDEFGLTDRAALLCSGCDEPIGLAPHRLSEIAAGADLLLNLSGLLRDERLIESIPVRVYVDLDPVFTQFWQAQDDIDMGFGGHTHFVTVGQAIGTADCPVPTCGLDWIPTLQPVVLTHWRPAGKVTRNALTTIANWRGYGSVWNGDTQYGQKVHSLRNFLALPQLSPKPLELALAIHPGETGDLDALHTHGWRLVDPARVAATPSAYHCYVQGSWAEIGIAKSGYVLARSGWFSDRSVCYLASGRPVVAQDTGFSRNLPTGEGLLRFTTLEEAALAIEHLTGSYRRHRRAARAIAEEYFDAATVLSRLLDRVGART
jgi:hypothetical protein